MSDKKYIFDIFETDQLTYHSLSGGDINRVYEVTVRGEKYVLKLNHSDDFPRMFEEEAFGLNQLKAADAIRIPEVIKTGVIENVQFLSMEYIEENVPNEDSWERLGAQLSGLHQQTRDTFGATSSNYIGVLHQSNKPHETWASFFVNERLIPQIQLARDSGLIDSIEVKKLERIYNKVNELWPKEKPALIHGDLWSGNLLFDEKADPVLIDPAVYYGHREMDLGMMELFGGFDHKVIETYNEHFPLEDGWEDRVAYNQLYPLLVHLNLFGTSYWPRIAAIVKPFS